MAQYSTVYGDFGNVYVPVGNMTVSSHVMLPSGDYDFITGGLKQDGQRRRRTQADRIRSDRLDSEREQLRASIERETAKKGIRVRSSAAWTLILLLVMVFSIMLLAQYGKKLDLQNKVERTGRAIAQYQKENAEIQAAIDAESDGAKICYYASRNLDMIPSASAAAVRLFAPDPNGAAQLSAQEEGQLAIAKNIP